MNLNRMEFLDEVTNPIRRFMCKLHGTTSDHNYEPLASLLFPGGEQSSGVTVPTEQEVVNLVWTMLEELRNVLEASNFFPKRVRHWMDTTRPTRDRGVQTDLEMELSDDKHVQITCNSEEFDRRINAFIKRKRTQADAFNRREFCKLHSEGEEAFSCARTDAVFVPRRSKKSLVRIERVFNNPEKKDQSPFKMSGLKSWPPIHPSSTLAFSNVPYDIKERLKSLQSVLTPRNPLASFSDVYGVLKKLENKVLYLETLSPEYFDLNRSSRRKRRFENNNLPLDRMTIGSSLLTNQNDQDNMKLLENRMVELRHRLHERMSSSKETKT